MKRYMRETKYRTPRIAISSVDTSSKGRQTGKINPSEHWSTRWGVEFRGAEVTSGGSARATTQQAASAASAGRMPRYAQRVGVRATGANRGRRPTERRDAPRPPRYVHAERRNSRRLSTASVNFLHRTRARQCEPSPPLMWFYYHAGP